MIYVPGLYCSDFTFNAEANQFTFTLSASGLVKIDYLLKELSLTQIIPSNHTYCWLNLSRLNYNQSFYEGLYIQTPQKVNLTLDCTEFESTDVQKGVWLFNHSIYEIREGRSPSVSTAAQQFVFHLRINYLPRGSWNLQKSNVTLTSDGWQEYPDPSRYPPVDDQVTSQGLYLLLLIIVLISILAAWRLGQKKEKSKKK